jgi:NAD(P)-dependent dehydrogenase (short-subunit alcohol dehydrogenase family)
MSRENGFENKRVVIVGGSSGIGLAVAEEAASQGAEVVIVSSKAERVQEAIQSIGGGAQGQAVDVSDEKAIESFFTNLGAFDHLVFTAGDSLQLHALADTDLKQARSAFVHRQIRESTNSKGRLYRSHDRSRRPAPAQRMGNCRKCLRNYRSSNPCPGD